MVMINVASTWHYVKSVLGINASALLIRKISAHNKMVKHFMSIYFVVLIENLEKRCGR